MELVNYFLIVGLFTLAYVCLWFVYSRKIDRLDVADEAWGLAQPAIAIFATIISGVYGILQTVLIAMTLVWGLRLFSHLRRRHKRSTEDSRYLEMKRSWTRMPVLKSFLYVFLLQGFLMVLLSSSVVLAVRESSANYYLLTAGVIFWLFGLAVEATADRQLRMFFADRKNTGQVMSSGLWRYSRHPNYFGEVVMWWSVFLVGYSASGNLLALISPLTITYLIVFVSGIPLAEKNTRNLTGWKDYEKNTSPLVPWFSKNGN